MNEFYTTTDVESTPPTTGLIRYEPDEDAVANLDEQWASAMGLHPEDEHPTSVIGNVRLPAPVGHEGGVTEFVLTSHEPDKFPGDVVIEQHWWPLIVKHSLLQIVPLVQIRGTLLCALSEAEAHEMMAAIFREVISNFERRGVKSVYRPPGSLADFQSPMLELYRTIEFQIDRADIYQNYIRSSCGRLQGRRRGRQQGRWTLDDNKDDDVMDIR